MWATQVLLAAGETDTSLAKHLPILEAIVAGDAQAAREAMASHMERAVRRLLATLSGSDGRTAERAEGAGQSGLIRAWPAPNRRAWTPASSRPPGGRGRAKSPSDEGRTGSSVPVAPTPTTGPSPHPLPPERLWKHEHGRCHHSRRSPGSVQGAGQPLPALLGGLE
ncbi:MAG: FCD domain-containing protein [Actinomycetota bacterium]|nr:FCD domain-containing protein [Candidatus Dormibacteraeota bacterium]MDQ6945106.1 FCD domain-containing protein [Actinomycetota bacterium]